MWDENGGKGDVGILIGVHEVYEGVGMGGSRMVVGCDGDGLGCCGGSDRGMNLKEGGIAWDPCEGEKLGRGGAR